jgi:hypothetical protein
MVSLLAMELHPFVPVPIGKLKPVNLDVVEMLPDDK